MTPNIISEKYRMPIIKKVCATPVELEELNKSINDTDKGEAIMAPPPNPIIAIPVAIPGLSGNHLIRVDTGEI